MVKLQPRTQGYPSPKYNSPKNYLTYSSAAGDP